MSEYLNRLLTNRVADVPKNKAVIIFGARPVGKLLFSNMSLEMKEYVGSQVTIRPT